jgi:hypothetical protein
MMIPIVVTLISVPVADAIYRLAGARPSDDLAGLYTAFGDGGFRYQANIATSADWFSGSFTIITDDLGLRCGSDSSTRVQPGSTADYLIFGDSQGLGQCLEYEASIVGEFAGLASQHNKRVANCSVGGHYLRNQLEIGRWLHDEKRINTENVIVLLTPFLISTAGEYVRAKVGADGKPYKDNPTLISRLAVWAKTNTTVFGRVRNAARNVAGIEQDNSALLGFFDTGERYPNREENLCTMLREIENWADSIGASFAIVYTPLTVELDFAGVSNLAAQKNLSVGANAPLSQATRASETLGLTLYNLRPVLSILLAADRPLTCRGDPHYNHETSAACAKSIWNSLEPSLAD